MKGFDFSSSRFFFHLSVGRKRKYAPVKENGVEQALENFQGYQKSVESKGGNKYDAMKSSVKVFQHHHVTETNNKPKNNLVLLKEEYKMRRKVFFRLVELNSILEMSDITLFQGLRTFDRYISMEKCKNMITEKTCMINATVCLFITSKIEEIFPPSSETFIRSIPFNVNLDQFLSLEYEILSRLGFSVQVSAPNRVLHEVLDVFFILCQCTSAHFREYLETEFTKLYKSTLLTGNPTLQKLSFKLQISTFTLFILLDALKLGVSTGSSHMQYCNRFLRHWTSLLTKLGVIPNMVPTLTLKK